MKKTVSILLIIAMIVTSLPFSAVYANPITVGAPHVVKYVSYILSLLGFKLYDSNLDKSFLSDYMSMITFEQYSDINDYLDTYDTYDNVEIRKKDIDVFLDVYNSLYYTASGLLDIVTGDNYALNFDVAKDVSLANELVGQVHKNRFYYRDYADDSNWQSRLENFVFGSSDKKNIILPFSDSIVSTLFAEINYENLKKLNLPFSYEIIYNTVSEVINKKVHTRYYVKESRRRLVDGALVDSFYEYSTQFNGAPFSGSDYYVYLKATDLDGVPCLFVRYYEESTKYSQGIKNMYIPYEIYKWRYMSYEETMQSLELLWDNSYIVNRLKSLYEQGKKIYADISGILRILDSPITANSNNYDEANERIVFPDTTIGSGLLQGVIQGLGTVNHAITTAGTSLKYAINGYVVDTTYDSALGGLGTGAQQGANEGVNDHITDLAGIGAGIMAIQKMLLQAKSIAQSQALAIDAIKNANFNNHNHDFKSPKNLNFLDKFPFCLAKDVHLLLSVFSSDAKQPIFEVNILGNVILLDFTRFETLANIIRTTVTITFILSLIVLTKKVVQ